uniref:Cir_N domain-containing protein n=1 Tax=Caenorhabditis japonica TaxID=281687 RepID=A0A8R1E0F3_CAEJA
MERVRRDERKAAEDEQRVLDRQIQAENERRINTLKAKADDRMSKMFGSSSSSTSTTKDVSISDETGHVNLFQDLEREERKNLGSGNKDYEAEKAAEKKEWESKMGIQVYFADNTNDLNKKKEWYEEMPIRRGPDKETIEKWKSKNALPCLKRNEEEKKRKRKREEGDSDDNDRGKKRKKKDKKKKKKKKKHRDSSEERALEEEYERERKQKLVAMREERLKRERAEKSRTHAFLHPEEEKKKKEEEEKRGKKRKYNSQFNPEFFRQ